MCIILKLLVILHLLLSMQIEANRRISQGEKLDTTEVIPFIVKILVTVKDKPGWWGPRLVEPCAGSYIRPNWILSATGCIKAFLPLTNHMGKHDVNLCMGEAHYDSCPEENRRLADGLYLHTEGDAYAEHDILLIHIAKPWVLGPTIQLAKLPTTKVVKESFLGKQCMVAGWGFYSTVSQNEILYKATVIIVEPNYCENINELQLCALGVTGQTCEGDNGGPLVLENTLIGVIVSKISTPCGYSGKASIFNMVQEYKDWIVSIAGPDSSTSIPQNKFSLPIVFVISLFNFILN